jgi:GntR family transcriptional regulator
MYRQIEAILRDQIASGEFAEGDRMHTEAELSEIYGVSRPTVRQALQRLELEKLVYRERGRGTFVGSVPRVLPNTRCTLSIDDLAELGDDIEVALQRKGTVKAPSFVYDALRLPPNTDVYFLIRTHSFRGRIIGAKKVFIPLAFAHKLRPSDLTARDTTRAIAARNRLKPARSDRTLEALLAEARFAEVLKTLPGAPLISVRCTSYDRNEVPFEHSHFLFRPDRCQFDLTHEYGARASRRK